jgi:RuvB-like protein 2
VGSSIRLSSYIILCLHSCQEEDVTLASDAQEVLTQMASQTTLRYALNLISCAQVIARKRKAEQVGVEDLRRAYTYFMDEKRSVQWLKEQQGTLVFEEVEGKDDAEKDVMDSS